MLVAVWPSTRLPWPPPVFVEGGNLGPLWPWRVQLESMTDSLRGEAPNWQLTPPWCPPSGRMGPPGAMQHTRWRCSRKHEERRSARTQSWQATGRARLVVVAAEVGGRFSAEANQFLPPRKVRGVLRKWRSMLGCKVANSFALSLLGRVPPSANADRHP